MIGWLRRRRDDDWARHEAAALILSRGETPLSRYEWAKHHGAMEHVARHLEHPAGRWWVAHSIADWEGSMCGDWDLPDEEVS